MNFKNVDISFDVCKKCDRTCMELFKKSENPCRFLIFLKCEFQKCWYFVWRMQKMLRHIDGIIQKERKSWSFFYNFEMWISKMLIFRLTYAKNAPSHRWHYSKRVKIRVVFLICLKWEFQKCWYFVWRMRKMLRRIDGIIQKERKSLSCF